MTTQSMNDPLSPSGMPPIRLMLVLMSLYTAQSVVSGIVNSSFPVVLRDAGVSLDMIGFVSLLTLPWALKILWAPLVDRYFTTPAWILSCQSLMIVCFLVLATLDVTVMPMAAFCVFVIIVFAAGTQDIATDATSIHATTTGTRTLASGASTAGGYMGYMIGGGVWLWVYAAFSWQAAILFAAGVLLVLTVPIINARARFGSTSANPKARLLDAIKSPKLRRGMLAVIGWQGAVRLTLTLSGTLLVDAGLDLETIAWIRGIGGMIVGLVTAVLATMLARKIGLKALLGIAAVLFMSLCLIQIVWLFGWLGGIGMLIAIQMGFSAAISVSFVAIYALMINFCSNDRAATDFSILQALDILLLVIGSIISGLIAEKFGYEPVLIIAATLMLLSWPLALRLAPAAAFSNSLQNKPE